MINFDEPGIIESLNPTAEKMFGYAHQEIIGRHISSIIPGFDTPSSNSNSLVFRSGIETLGCRKNETCFPMEISISTLDMKGRRTFIAIINDITERKQAAALMANQKEFMENLLQNSAVPTFVVDAAHRVLIWNRACEELTGTKAEAMLGKDEAWKAFYTDKRPVLADVVIDGSVEHSSAYYSEVGRSSFIP